ncbi:hypothetical protein DFJ73DRAFT_84517 [Zopfochytrium polystomum]|nr:hypothetical protein DFJ73DRAFT_84517 [Zopfochytrium polystomum]
MVSSSSNAEEYVNEVDPAPKKVFWTRRKKMAFAICCGVGLIVALVVILLVIFVIVPKIAQDTINKSEITFQTVKITSIQDSQFTLDSKGSVGNAGAFPATLSTGPVTIFWADRPGGAADLTLGTLNLDPISISGGAADLIVNSASVTVTDEAAMGQFSKYLISSSTFTWRLVATASVKALGITANNLSLDKKISFSGFGGLTDVKITGFDLPSGFPAQGIVIKTNTTISNPSIITIELGDLEFDTYVDQSKIGTLSAKAVTLTPGVNSLSLSGFLKAINATDIATLEKVFGFFLGGIDNPLNVVGTSVTPPKGTVDWLQTGFSGLTLSAVLAGETAEQRSKRLISNLKIPAISVTFSSQYPDGYTVFTSAPTITADLYSPFNFTLNVIQTTQDIAFVDPSSNTSLAKLYTANNPATSNTQNTKLSTSFSNAPLTTAGTTSSYENFFSSLTLKDSYTFNVKGVATALCDTDAGKIKISNVSVTDTLTFKGFSGLTGVTVNSVSVDGGNSNGISLSIGTAISNPSDITLALNGDVSLDLKASTGEVLGTVTLPNVSLAQGANTVSATSLFNPQGDAAVAAGRILLSNYLGKKDQEVSIAGSSSSVSYKALQPAFSQLAIKTTLPAIKVDLVTGSSLSLVDLTVKPASATTALNIVNPLNSDFTITHLEAAVKWNNVIIGNIKTDLSATIPKNSQKVVDNVPLLVDVTSTSIKAIKQGLTGELKVDITSIIGASVGAYPATVDYALNGIVITVG